MNTEQIIKDFKKWYENFHDERFPCGWDVEGYIKSSILTPLEKQIEELQSQLRETQVLNDAYAEKILRQNQHIEALKKEIHRLHEQQLEVDWEVQADEMGLDKDTQEQIKRMADNAIKSAEEDKKYVADLKAENTRLKEALKDIAQWDEDMEDKWEDPGFRAKAALNPKPL
jgi:DNA repair exonuclease SbcCD ATPase subunit